MGKSSIDAAGAAKKSNKPKCECAREQQLFLSLSLSVREMGSFFISRARVGFLSLSLSFSLSREKLVQTTRF
jgi:hypothetical protein